MKKATAFAILLSSLVSINIQASTNCKPNKVKAAFKIVVGMLTLEPLGLLLYHQYGAHSAEGKSILQRINEGLFFGPAPVATAAGWLIIEGSKELHEAINYKGEE